MNRPGFSLTDLLMALVMLVVIALFSVAATVNLDNSRTRVKCASNLRQIGQALLLYSNDTRGSYPRTRYEPGAADRPTAYTGVDSPSPFAATCPQVNDVSAALYLLLRTEDIQSSAFICPATGQTPYDYGGGRQTNQDKSNFPSEEVLSYSYADPYPSVAAAALGYKMVQGIDPIVCRRGRHESRERGPYQVDAGIHRRPDAGGQQRESLHRWTEHALRRRPCRVQQQPLRQREPRQYLYLRRTAGLIPIPKPLLRAAALEFLVHRSIRPTASCFPRRSCRRTRRSPVHRKPRRRPIRLRHWR